MPIAIPTYVEQACSQLTKRGFQAYLVGGAVRDSLLGTEPLDWDVATNALPDQIEEIFTKTVPTGKKFGTITVFVHVHAVEITTMRSDGPYRDHRHPDHVLFTDSLEIDLSRRDFTINAIAYDPFAKKILDPFSGSKHLKKRLLTTVGEPGHRFQEDPLRMLRLLRFQATLGFKVEKKTKKAIEAQWIKRVSPERIQTELNKMLVGRELASALKLFYQSGLMQEIIPELAAGAGISPGKNHPYDLLGHSIMSAHFAYPSLETRWAALLHDVGKLYAPGREHEKISASLARQILTRLRFSNKLIHTVEKLVANHMFDVHPQSSDRALRRFLAKVGTETAYQLVKLRQADMAGLNTNPRLILNYGKTMEIRLDQILAAESALRTQDLAVDGRTLMFRLNIQPGPLLGEILRHLLEVVLAEPHLNQTDSLLEAAQDYLKSKHEK